MRRNRNSGVQEDTGRKKAKQRLNTRGKKIRRQTQNSKSTKAVNYAPTETSFAAPFTPLVVTAAKERGIFSTGGVTFETFSLASAVALATLEASPLALWSGDGIRLPSFGRKGGGACSTWAAVRPFGPEAFGELFVVEVPFKVGNSSNVGTRWARAACCFLLLG